MKLPTEILFFIFRYLNKNDLLITETVCRGWYRAARIIIYENVRLTDKKVARFLQLESSLQFELGGFMKRMYFSSTGGLSQEHFSQLTQVTPNIQEFDSGSVHAAKYLTMHENSQWKYLSKLIYRAKDYDVCAYNFRHSLSEINILNDIYSNHQVLANYLKDFSHLNTVNVALGNTANILVCNPIVECCPKLKSLNLCLQQQQQQQQQTLMDQNHFGLFCLDSATPCRTVLDKVTLDLDRFCPESIIYFIRKFPHIKKLALSSEFYEWTDSTFQTLNQLFAHVALSDSSSCQFKTRYESNTFLYALGYYGSLLARKKTNSMYSNNRNNKVLSFPIMQNNRNNNNSSNEKFQQNYFLVTTSYHFPFSFRLDTDKNSCNTKIYYPCNATTFDRFDYTNECIKALGPTATSFTIQSYYHANYNSSVTSAVIDDVIESCKNLTSLTLLYEKRTILPLQRVSHNITQLKLKECRISLDFFKSLSYCLPFLDTLELVDCIYIPTSPDGNNNNNGDSHIVLDLAFTNLQKLIVSHQSLGMVDICTGNKTRRFLDSGDDISNSIESASISDEESDMKSTYCITVKCRSLKYLVADKSDYLVNMDPEDLVIR